MFTNQQWVPLALTGRPPTRELRGLSRLSANLLQSSPKLGTAMTCLGILAGAAIGIGVGLLLVWAVAELLEMID